MSDKTNVPFAPSDELTREQMIEQLTWLAEAGYELSVRRLGITHTVKLAPLAEAALRGLAVSEKVALSGETPRTDAECDHPYNIHLDNERAERLGKPTTDRVVSADFARTLERELEFAQDKWVECAGDLGDMRERAEKAESERDALREMNAGDMKMIQTQEAEIADLKHDIDRAITTNAELTTDLETCRAVSVWGRK